MARKNEQRRRNDLVEIFGYSPNDLTPSVRSLWELGACPFINKSCSKANHDKTIIYGTCSVTTAKGDCIVCPNRMYEDNYSVLRRVASEVFGADIQFLMFDQYIPLRSQPGSYVVALGQNSGREVRLGQKLSMDWVLAKIESCKLVEYVGIEVQSIDITNNYRDAWHSYRNLHSNAAGHIPESEHGMNWANVHKRLIPQIIRKGRIYASSDLVQKGLYFIVPDVVYKKFEDIIGADIPCVEHAARNTLTIHTYELSQLPPHGTQRVLVPSRNITVSLDEFAQRFISGANLPSGGELDGAIRVVLGL